MRQVGIVAAITVFGAMTASQASAQIIGPTIIVPGMNGPRFASGGSGRFHNQLARASFSGERCTPQPTARA